jgi:O-antigen/teichoic acid export membrane protein
VILPAAVLVSAFSQEIVLLFYTEAYVPAAPALSILMGTRIFTA